MCLGIPGRITRIVDAQQLLAVAEVDGRPREISVALLGIAGEDGHTIGEGGDPIEVGDWVDIHLGFAMSKLDEQEAHEMLTGLKALGEEYEQEMSQFMRAAETGEDVGVEPKTA